LSKKQSLDFQRDFAQKPDRRGYPGLPLICGYRPFCRKLRSNRRRFVRGGLLGERVSAACRLIDTAAADESNSGEKAPSVSTRSVFVPPSGD
jgi:hypothetical protein